MKACKFHDPAYLSPPEQYAQALCRGSGPPNEKARGDEPRASEGGDQAALRGEKPTPGALQIQLLAALYGQPKAGGILPRDSAKDGA